MLKQTVKKITIIANPTSGRYKLKIPLFSYLIGIKKNNNGDKKITTICKKVQNYFDKEGITTDIVYTQQRGDGTRLAIHAKNNNTDLIIAIGGDGSINEIVNGIANSHVILGVIPRGTANIFGLAFNLPTRIKKACNKILNGTVQTIDLGKIGPKYFVCMAGIGFDALVIKHTSRKQKQLLGPISFILSAFKLAFQYKFNPILFTIDNTPTPTSATFVVICNLKYYGGTLALAPHATPTDGYLDICCFNVNNTWQLLLELIKLKLKLKTSTARTYLMAKEIQFQNKEPLPHQVDGEYLTTPLNTITVVPNSLKIIN